METTPQDKDKIREIINHLIADDKEWLNQQWINVGYKGPYWILNYAQGPRTEYNRLVRGMIVRKPTNGFNGDPLSLITSFPFTRFFNQGELDAAHVDFSNAEMLEKMDGTMLGVFFPNGEPTDPHFHTRKMVSLHNDDMKRTMTNFYGKEVTFLPAIRKYVDQLTFNSEDVVFTYVFEFVDEISKVVTKYQPHQFGLYLIGARNILTHRELTEDELDQVAKKIGSKRPRRWHSIANQEEIEKMFDLAAEETPDFEGFIFRDKTTGNRVKVKDPRYVRKHHMIDGSHYKYLIPSILKGEADEIVTYFPHVKERINEFLAAFERYINEVTERVLHWKSLGLTGGELSKTLFGEQPLSKWEVRLKKMRGETQKKAEVKEKDGFTRNAILKYHKLSKEEIKVAVENELRKIALGVGTNLGNPRHLMELIGLHEEEDDTIDIGEI